MAKTVCVCCDARHGKTKESPGNKGNNNDGPLSANCARTLRVCGNTTLHFSCARRRDKRYSLYYLSVFRTIRRHKSLSDSVKRKAFLFKRRFFHSARLQDERTTPCVVHNRRSIVDNRRRIRPEPNPDKGFP